MSETSREIAMCGFLVLLDSGNERTCTTSCTSNRAERRCPGGSLLLGGRAIQRCIVTRSRALSRQSRTLSARTTVREVGRSVVEVVDRLRVLSTESSRIVIALRSSLVLVCLTFLIGGEPSRGSSHATAREILHGRANSILRIFRNDIF